jgi:hypothetical protein
LTEVVQTLKIRLGYLAYPGVLAECGFKATGV